ncbi:MAG: MutS-related protein [Longimicrobiales bacterium]
MMGARGEGGAPYAAYAAEVAACDQALAGLRSRSARLSTVRVATFLAGAAALLVVDVAEGPAALLAGVAAAVLAAAFAGEVAAHRRVRSGIRWEEAFRALGLEGTLRLERRWGELAAALPAAEARVEAAHADHPYARDLDVLGEASLARLAGPVTSERGRARLRSWLLAPAAPEEVSRRQQAIRELAPVRQLRHALAAHGRLHGAADPPGTELFLAWAEGVPWLLARPGLRAAAVALPAVLLALLVADFAFALPPLWLVPALAHAELMRRHWRRLNADFSMAEDGAALLDAYVPQLRLLEGEKPAAPMLAELAGGLGTGDASASASLHRLSRLLDTVESRRNLLYGPLAAVLLLDFHLAWRLDRWRAASGTAVRSWLEALGTWEAISALATLAHDHPDWSFPDPAEEPALRASALGHPLLRPDSCVRNDVTVGPPGTFLLVTGSNMSGKSTLLRALGANAVLAGAGAPVCAAALSMPRVRVRTSMRVDDSLAEGVSLFMAELLRIRGIVGDADEPGAEGRVLFLLDEVFHGTNTAERRVAARAVIRHLLARDALGAVSTHDLTLAKAPDLEGAAVPVHFRESMAQEGGETSLTFDYLLRPGVATTRNALRLLDAVGLGGLVGKEEPGDEIED